MKMVANIQLRPTRQQELLLRQTLIRCNAACNWLSQQGFNTGKTRQFALHKLAYREARGRFEIAAQIAVRCIAKVANAYTAQTANKREGLVTFRDDAAQPYDERVFRFMSADTVSIWTLDGRQQIPFICGPRQHELLKFKKGEVDLMLVRNKWYIAVVCDIPEPSEIDVEGVLGVDFGVVNLAFDSQGKPYTGAEIERVRQKYGKRRAGLQRRGTKAAKRRLKKLAGKEARFRKHSNHCISKEIVTCAKRSRLAIGLENLTHIRKRVKARKTQRNRLHGWAFAQLRQFVTYKAKLNGIPIIVVNPRNTSRACPACGVIDKANRKTQAVFSCISCGTTAPADFIAAKNISIFAGAANSSPALSSRRQAGKRLSSQG